MKATNDWQQFMNTGSVEAYLSYRTECEKCKERLKEDFRNVGVGAYAGISERNRHDSKNGAYR